MYACSAIVPVQSVCSTFGEATHESCFSNVLNCPVLVVCHWFCAVSKCLDSTGDDYRCTLEEGSTKL